MLKLDAQTIGRLVGDFVRKQIAEEVTKLQKTDGSLMCAIDNLNQRVKNLEERR